MALFQRDQGLLQRDLSLVNFGFKWHFSIQIQFSIFWDRMYVWKRIIAKFLWHCISVWSLDDTNYKVSVNLKMLSV